MGEFSHLQKRRRPGIISELRGLSRAAKLAIGAVFLAAFLAISTLSALNRPAAATASSSAPYQSTYSNNAYGTGMIAMPNYVGWSVQAAIDDLLQRGIVIRAASSAAAASTVLAQTPNPGTTITQATANLVQFTIPVAPTTTTTTTAPPTTTTTEPPASDTDVHIDVDEHHNLPDGALTGGYCRRKWWC